MGPSATFPIYELTKIYALCYNASSCWSYTLRAHQSALVDSSTRAPIRKGGASFSDAGADVGRALMPGIPDLGGGTTTWPACPELACEACGLLQAAPIEGIALAAGPTGGQAGWLPGRLAGCQAGCQAGWLAATGSLAAWLRSCLPSSSSQTLLGPSGQAKLPRRTRTR